MNSKNKREVSIKNKITIKHKNKKKKKKRKEKKRNDMKLLIICSEIPHTHIPHHVATSLLYFDKI